MKLGVQTVAPGASPANGQFSRAGEFGPGSLLDDRFAITDVICNGGMAAIYKANDLQNDGRVVAIKIPHRSAEADPALFSRFHRFGKPPGFGKSGSEGVENGRVFSTSQRIGLPG